MDSNGLQCNGAFFNELPRFIDQTPVGDRNTGLLWKTAIFILFHNLVSSTERTRERLQLGFHVPPPICRWPSFQHQHVRYSPLPGEKKERVGLFLFNASFQSFRCWLEPNLFNVIALASAPPKRLIDAFLLFSPLSKIIWSPSRGYCLVWIRRLDLGISVQ